MNSKQIRLTGLSLLGLGIWIGIISYNHNVQKASTPVVRGIMHKLRTDNTIQELLGGPPIQLNPLKIVQGDSNDIKRKANIQFKVLGKEKKGTVRFVGFKEGSEWYSNEFHITVDEKQYPLQ